MKVMYCWRCKMEVPMLDEDEFAIAAHLYSEGIRATKAFRQKYQLPLEQCSLEERFRPLREAYKQITDWEETNANAIMHHRTAIYGPPCEQCGKPLRTPRAAFCAACGHPVPGHKE